MKKSLLIVFCASILLASLSFAAERPNILYLYVDDMGWGAIGPNGQAEREAAGEPFVLTPNLDRLAAAGVNFRRGYGCTVCSPARSSQQTGFHQGYTFADRNDPGAINEIAALYPNPQLRRHEELFIIADPRPLR